LLPYWLLQVEVAYQSFTADTKNFWDTVSSQIDFPELTGRSRKVLQVGRGEWSLPLFEPFGSSLLAVSSPFYPDGIPDEREQLTTVSLFNPSKNWWALHDQFVKTELIDNIAAIRVVSDSQFGKKRLSIGPGLWTAETGETHIPSMSLWENVYVSRSSSLQKQMYSVTSSVEHYTTNLEYIVPFSFVSGFFTRNHDSEDVFLSLLGQGIQVRQHQFGIDTALSGAPMITISALDHNAQLDEPMGLLSAGVIWRQAARGILDGVLDSIYDERHDRRFIEMKAGEKTTAALHLPGDLKTSLYGVRTYADGRTAGHIVEIHPPISAFGGVKTNYAERVSSGLAISYRFISRNDQLSPHSIRVIRHQKK